ncbi:MAG: hypothetical protein WC322_05915 [Candidatus Paceibacterota bacterium]|jgi:hypothetical protein
MARKRKITFDEWAAIVEKICVENLGKYPKLKDAKGDYISGMTPLQAYEREVKSRHIAAKGE